MHINLSKKHLEILRSNSSSNCLASFHVNIVLVHFAIGHYNEMEIIRKILNCFIFILNCVCCFCQLTKHSKLGPQD